MLRALSRARFFLSFPIQPSQFLFTALPLLSASLSSSSQFACRPGNAWWIRCRVQNLTLKSARETGDGIWVLLRGSLEEHNVLFLLRQGRDPSGQHVFR